MKIYVANLGDCRSLLLRRNDRGEIKAIALSRDHKAVIEKERIKRLGGYVSCGRLNGIIIISRAIGDKAFKKKVHIAGSPNNAEKKKKYLADSIVLVGRADADQSKKGTDSWVDKPFSELKHGISNPNLSINSFTTSLKRSNSMPSETSSNLNRDIIYCYDPEKKKSKFSKEKPPLNHNLVYDSLVSSNPEITIINRTEQDYMVINGSDGLYDYYSNKKIAKYTSVMMEPSRKTNLDLLCKNLCESSYFRGSEDDITCIAMLLRSDTHSSSIGIEKEPEECQESHFSLERHNAGKGL